MARLTSSSPLSSIPFAQIDCSPFFPQRRKDLLNQSLFTFTSLLPVSKILLLVLYSPLTRTSYSFSSTVLWKLLFCAIHHSFPKDEQMLWSKSLANRLLRGPNWRLMATRGKAKAGERRAPQQHMCVKKEKEERKKKEVEPSVNAWPHMVMCLHS